MLSSAGTDRRSRIAAVLRSVPVAVLRSVVRRIRVAVRVVRVARIVRVVPVVGVVEVREHEEWPAVVVVVVLVRDWSSTEAATPELSASRRTPAAVASAGEAAPVPSPHGGPRRTASQREHQEGGDEEDWQPTVPMSCRAGHDHRLEATAVPAFRGTEPPETPVTARFAPRVSLAFAETRRRHVGACRHVVSSDHGPTWPTRKRGAPHAVAGCPKRPLPC